MKRVKCFACLLTTIGGFYGGLSAAAQAADFYHGTKLEYAMDMVAKNGIELRRPVNGSELGLGFYVTQRENSAS